METVQKIPIRRTRDFGEIFNVTFEFLRQNIRPLLKGAVFIAGPAFLLVGIAFGYYFTQIFEVSADPYGSSSGDFTGIIVAVIGMMIASVVSMILLFAVVFGYLNLYMERGSEGIELEDIWAEAKGNAGRITGTMFGFFGISLLAGGALALISISMPILGVILMFLAIFPAVYLFVAWSFVVPARIYEPIGFIEALSRSMELVKGYWLRTFGILIAVAIINWIMSLVFAVPLYITMFLVGFFNIDYETGTQDMMEMDPTMSAVVIIGSIISMFGSYLTYIIPLLTVAFQYFDLVERKEGVGLMERIDEIGVTE